MTSELRPAVEVWRQAHQALYWLPKGAIGEQGAAAVIQAYGDEREAKGREEQAAELAKFKAVAETLAGALEVIRSEAQREKGSWLHLKRCIAAQSAEALRQYKEARDAGRSA